MDKKTILLGIKSATTPLLLLIGIVANCVIAIRNFERRQEQNAIIERVVQDYDKKIKEFESVIRQMPTNILQQVEAQAIETKKNELDPTKEIEKSPIIRDRYLYMVIDGYPAIRYYGRHYNKGSPFGNPNKRIAYIYPNKLILSDGSEVHNTYNPDINGAYFSASTQNKKETSENDI